LCLNFDGCHERYHNAHKALFIETRRDNRASLASLRTSHLQEVLFPAAVSQLMLFRRSLLLLLLLQSRANFYDFKKKMQPMHEQEHEHEQGYQMAFPKMSDNGTTRVQSALQRHANCLAPNERVFCESVILFFFLLLQNAHYHTVRYKNGRLATVRTSLKLG
jgi:hypothetical protein